MAGKVVRVAKVKLIIPSSKLPFEINHAAQIDTHWAKAVAEKPAMFDGRVHLATGYLVEGDALHVNCVPGRFATLLYWRDVGHPDTTFRQVFGCVVPRSSDGAFLLGQMSANTSNAGRVYFPGGVIDESDVQGDQIDIDTNITREMEEELGLKPIDIPFALGYRVCVTDVAIAIGRILELPWPAEEARTRLLDTANAHGDGEIADLIIVRNPTDLDGLPVVPYAKAFIAGMLEQL